MYPLDDLHEHFRNHSRLRVFAAKGCVCVACGREGTHLRLHTDRGGGRHVDLYTDENVLMTVDHINPKSNGGSEHIDNLQPLYTNCNNKKAADVPTGHAFPPAQVNGTREANADPWRHREAELFEKSFQRPQDFFRMPQDEQWEVDKWLGLLDWEGGCVHHRFRPCKACKARMQAHYD